MSRCRLLIPLLSLLLAACEISDITPPAAPPPTPTLGAPTVRATSLPTRPAPPQATTPDAPAPVLSTSGSDLPTPSPAPEGLEGLGDILYSDSFDGNHGWDVGPSQYGTIAISGGMLHVSVSAPNTFLRTLWDQPPVKNVYYEITARPGLCSGRDEYALLFHLTDPDNYYRFSLTCDGYVQAAKTVGGASQVLKDWTATSAYILGAPSESRIGVWTFEGRTRFYVNDHLVLSLTDSTFSGGRAGVFVRSGLSANTSVSFDDLVIRAINP